MRSLTLFIPLSLVGCIDSHKPEAPVAPNVRARLSEPTKLMVAPASSTGSLTASRYTHDGWQDGTIAVTMANGELDASAAADGQLSVSGFSINIDPIDIPPSVFGKAVTLKDVRLVLADKIQAATSWSDADDAVALASVTLDLQWTLVVDNNASPLGAQHLTGLPVAITLSGTGAEVDAAIAVDAVGDLWSWADLFKLTALHLQLDANTDY
jgi:hypothetical protein